MNNVSLVIIVVIMILASGFILVKSGEEARPSQTQNKEATQSAVPKGKYGKFPGVLPEKERVGKNVRIKTNKGTIEIELFSNEVPKAVSNFIFLTNEGFYNGLKFHRREEGFVIQGGDPNGDGTGSPGYTFEDEPVKRNYDRGTVAMANSGPNTNGSQFFIVLADNKELPKNYTIFGKVTKGMDTVDQIKVGDVTEKVEVF